MTVDRNVVTKPKTTTVIIDQNGRSTITSIDRPVMYASCNRTARTRSNDIDMPVPSRNLQEHVLQRRFPNVDVEHLHPGIADREDRRRNQFLFGIDHDDVLALQLHVAEARAQVAVDLT